MSKNDRPESLETESGGRRYIGMVGNQWDWGEEKLVKTKRVERSSKKKLEQGLRLQY